MSTLGSSSYLVSPPQFLVSPSSISVSHSNLSPPLYFNTQTNEEFSPSQIGLPPILRSQSEELHVSPSQSDELGVPSTTMNLEEYETCLGLPNKKTVPNTPIPKSVKHNQVVILNLREWALCWASKDKGTQ